MTGLPTLPFIDLVNFKGLFTKSSPDVVEAEQLRIAENVDFFDTYGAIGKVKGNTRILASQFTQNSVVKAIPWIQFYKSSTLAGEIVRHTLVAAGSILGKIESDGTITTLLTGRTENLFHSAAQLDRFMYITNQNIYLVGEGDDLVKYDGAVISKWGIEPPGDQETIIESFSDASSFDRKPASAFTVSDDTSITWDGDAIRLDKTGTSSGRIFYIEKQYSPFYVSSDARPSDKHSVNRLRFFAYIPRGQLTADYINSSTFNTGEAAMAVWVSPDNDTVERNHWKFYYSIGQLIEGWNLLTLDFSGGPVGERGQFYPEVDTVNRIRWDFRLNEDSHTRTGIRLDRFAVLDEGTPEVNPTGTGDFNGTYQYKVTFISKYGHESNAGPASQSVTASDAAQFELTRIPVSNDPQVIARNLYRTVGNGSVFLFVKRLNNNTLQEWVDSTSDSNLGNSTPPQAGDFSDDNSPPPKAGIVQKWKETIFMAGDPQNPTLLYFSDVDSPESFPLINTFELDDRITAIYETYSALIVETETGKWQVIGENPDFSVDKVVDNMGCVGRRAAGKTRLVGYAVDRDGMRLFDGNEPSKISETIRDKYDALEKSNIELIHTAHSKAINKVLQFNPDDNLPIPNYESCFSFQYNIDDVTKGYWSTLELPSTLNIISTTEIEDSNGDFKLYGSSSDGMVYELFNKDSLSWVDASGDASAIRTRFQTPYIRAGALGAELLAVTGRIEPRFVEMRVKDNTAITWTVTIESADGPSQTNARDSQELELVFGTNNSMIRQSLKPNFHPGEYVRITVENNQQDVECEITGMRIYFKVHPFEGQKIEVSSV